jgi:4'-phosphopantetheinyl transferase
VKSGAIDHDHQAQIRIVDLDTIPDAQLTPLLAHLSESETARYHRIAREQRKKQFLAGRLLLRYALSNLYDIDAREIVPVERERQAPQVRIAGVKNDPFFSISHSAQWAACASSLSVPLGLDIELIDARRNLEAISEHTFSSEEVTWLKQQPDKLAAFYRLWGKKEARFKLTQGYDRAPTEHCYEFPHPALSIVLMTEQALVATPELQSLEWEGLRDFFS